LEMNVLGLRALGKAMRADSGSMPAGRERPVLHHSSN
jgi:hypothetical protein